MNIHEDPTKIRLEAFPYIIVGGLSRNIKKTP